MESKRAKRWIKYRLGSYSKRGVAHAGTTRVGELLPLGLGMPQVSLARRFHVNNDSLSATKGGSLGFPPRLLDRPERFPPGEVNPNPLGGQRG